MIRILATASVLALLTASLGGCTSETEFGPCVGVGDTPNPKLLYRHSSKNIILGIIFVETIFVPAVVLMDEISCPIGLADLGAQS